MLKKNSEQFQDNERYEGLFVYDIVYMFMFLFLKYIISTVTFFQTFYSALPKKHTVLKQFLHTVT